MRLRRIIWCAVGSIVAIGLLALVPIVLPFVDTFEDMRLQLERTSVPPDFEWIGLSENGLRSRFAAAPGPSAQRSYSAPWDNGRLCDRMAELARNKGPITPVPHYGTCAFSVQIPAGWSARVVNVWHYRLVFSAIEPEGVRRYTDDAQCEKSREQHSKLGGGMWFRFEPCWVPAGRALIHITVYGKVGL